MKGSLHTDELMHAVLIGEGPAHRPADQPRLRPRCARPIRGRLFITDAAINIAPDLDDKRDIVQNAIDLARARHRANRGWRSCRRSRPSTRKMPSTLEAAALCKMADRGQITGGMVDGPLAFDNAIDQRRRATRGSSRRSPDRPISFVVPDLEAGNMLAKQLTTWPARCGRARARRAGADHPDQPRRHRAPAWPPAPRRHSMRMRAGPARRRRRRDAPWTRSSSSTPARPA